MTAEDDRRLRFFLKIFSASLGGPGLEAETLGTGNQYKAREKSAETSRFSQSRFLPSTVDEFPFCLLSPRTRRSAFPGAVVVLCQFS